MQGRLYNVYYLQDCRATDGHTDKSYIIVAECLSRSLTCKAWHGLIFGFVAEYLLCETMGTKESKPSLVNDAQHQVEQQSEQQLVDHIPVTPNVIALRDVEVPGDQTPAPRHFVKLRPSLPQLHIAPPVSMEVPGLLGLLDDDSFFLIARHLPLTMVGRLSCVCKPLYFLLKSEHLWGELYKRDHGDTCVSGMEDDYRDRWRKQKSVENMLLYRQPMADMMVAHDEGVGIMYLNGDTLITGGKDDAVRMWDVSEYPFKETATVRNVGKWVWGYVRSVLLLSSLRLFSMFVGRCLVCTSTMKS